MEASFAAPYPFEMFDRVGYVNPLARNSRFNQCLVKQTPRRPDEWMALPIFLIAGLLSDKHDVRSFRSFAEDRLSGVLVKITASAGTCGVPQSFESAFLRQEIVRGAVQFSSHNFRLSFFQRQGQMASS
jgi:hypothetical protein